MSRETLRITLPGRIATELTRRAELSGIPVSSWAAEIVESFIAGERCQHGARRNARQPSTPRGLFGPMCSVSRSPLARRRAHERDGPCVDPAMNDRVIAHSTNPAHWGQNARGPAVRAAGGAWVARPINELSAFNSASSLFYVVIKAYLDGSGHGDTKSKFVTLSGFVGTPDAWSEFEVRWGKILAQHGAPYLHMVEAMHCGGAFARRKGWTREKVYTLLKDLFNQCLTKLKRDEFVGLSCTVDLVAHDVVQAEGKKLRSAEAICADYCVDVGLKVARLLHGPPALPSGSVEVFFDRHEPYERWAKRAWTRKRSAPWWADAVASMPPADWRVVMGLQAADMTAWAFNRHYTKQDDWVGLFASIVKAQFHKFYGEAELRALP